MEERKGYHCPVEATLDLIGGKYKTLILWHLAGGPQRFSQLQRLISRATPKMLTQQLRELEEETGYTPATLTYMGALLSSPGFTDEVLHMYLARGLKPGECHPDEDEFLERDRVPLGELVKEVMDGTIQDAKTVAAVLKAKVLLDL